VVCRSSGYADLAVRLSASKKATIVMFTSKCDAACCSRLCYHACTAGVGDAIDDLLILGTCRTIKANHFSTIELVFCLDHA
jgi:hypothetical protein